MNQADFADVMVDLFVQCENLFLAAPDTMRTFRYSSYPGFELEHGGQPFTMQIKLNMVKQEPGKRGYKALNVWLLQSDYYNRQWGGTMPILWMQDDPECGFDYQIWTTDSCYGAIAEVIALFRDHMLEIAPSLILYELAGIKPDAQLITAAG